MMTSSEIQSGFSCSRMTETLLNFWIVMKTLGKHLSGSLPAGIKLNGLVSVQPSWAMDCHAQNGRPESSIQNAEISTMSFSNTRYTGKTTQ